MKSSMSIIQKKESMWKYAINKVDSGPITLVTDYSVTEQDDENVFDGPKQA